MWVLKMNETAKLIAILEKSYDYHLAEMCRHDSILEWIDDEIDRLELRYERGQINAL